MPAKVKICGITNLADAELACDLGAWALGMIFYEPSPRRCSLEAAAVISARLRRRVELCGVFVNSPAEEVVGVAEELGLSLLQLHGDEGPSLSAELGRRTGARVIKAVQVSSPGDVRAIERFHVDFHLLDAAPTRRPDAPRGAPPKGSAPAGGLRGGTGETFDWGMLAGRRSRIPLILSGGLDADNVQEAIARTHPWGVDVASGTESAPGHKDPAKLSAFFAAVTASGAPSDATTPASTVGQPA